MRKAKSRKFRTLSEVLPGLLRRWNLDEALRGQQALAAWPSVVGSKLAEHSRALSLVDGRLLVAVDSPGWATQLGYLKPDILKKYGRRLGKERVTDIRFVLGPDRQRRGHQAD